MYLFVSIENDILLIFISQIPYNNYINIEYKDN